MNGFPAGFARSLRWIDIARDAHLREADDVHAASVGGSNLSLDRGQVVVDRAFLAKHLDESDIERLRHVVLQDRLFVQKMSICF
jgi:hypothetical protein